LDRLADVPFDKVLQSMVRLDRYLYSFHWNCTWGGRDSVGLFCFCEYWGQQASPRFQSPGDNHKACSIANFWRYVPPNSYYKI
jgi:hypothetical protein